MKNILKASSSLIRQRSDTVSLPISSEIIQLSEDLKDAIRYKDTLWPGDGLSISAVQIGVPLQVFIISRNWYTARQRAFDTIINPQIDWKSSSTCYDWEGCLSVPTYQCLVERSRSIKVSYINVQGKVIEETINGFKARIFQHEMDHLEGVLMIDKAFDKRLYKR